MEQIKNLLDSILDLDLFDLLKDKSIDTMVLLNQRFNASDVNISSRVLKHWKENDLLPEPVLIDSNYQKSGDEDVNTNNIIRERNKFDFFGLIYMYILQDLRGFGISLKKLKRVKEFLYSKINILDICKEFPESYKDIAEVGVLDIKSFHQSLEIKNMIEKEAKQVPESLLEAPFLMYIILNIIVSKSDLKLAITIDGDVALNLTNMVGQTIGTKYNRQPHIVLPLYNYLYHFVSMKKYKKYYTMYRLLNDKELYILEQVRSGLYYEIVIKMNAGESVSMELKEELIADNAARLQDILLRGKYQELVVKTVDGVVQYTALKTNKKL